MDGAIVMSAELEASSMAALRPHTSRVRMASGEFGGDTRVVSVVMADLRGYTAFCERVNPARAATVLNDYLTVMVRAIVSRNGRVQDFVGDGVLGVFGAPGEDVDHAWHAVLSALDMHAAIKDVNDRWRRAGVALAMGVAVHTGLVFAGTLGPSGQTKYAVVGDPVNSVERLEKLNRDLGTTLILSGETLAWTRDRVAVRARGSYLMPGRSRSIQVFEVLGMAGRCLEISALCPPCPIPVRDESR